MNSDNQIVSRLSIVVLEINNRNKTMIEIKFSRKNKKQYPIHVNLFE